MTEFKVFQDQLVLQRGIQSLILTTSLGLFAGGFAFSSETEKVILEQKVEKVTTKQVEVIDDFNPFSLLEEGFKKTKSDEELKKEQLIVFLKEYNKKDDLTQRTSLLKFKEIAKNGYLPSLELLGNHYKKNSDLKNAFRYYAVFFVMDLRSCKKYDEKLLANLKSIDEYESAYNLCKAIESPVEGSEITKSALLDIYEKFFIIIQKITIDNLSQHERNLLSFEIFKNFNKITEKRFKLEGTDSLFFYFGEVFYQGAMGTEDATKPNYEMALKFFENSNRPDSLFKIGTILCNELIKGKKDIKKAEDYFRKSKTPDALTRLAQICYDKGNEEEAVKFWKEVNTPLALHNVGYAYYKKEDFKNAEKFFMQSRTSDSFYNLGYMYLYEDIIDKESNVQKAIEYFQKSDISDSRRMLAYAYLLESREKHEKKDFVGYKKSLETSRKIYENLNTDEGLYWVGVTYLDEVTFGGGEGTFIKAKESFEKAKEYFEKVNTPQSISALGMLHFWYSKRVENYDTKVGLLLRSINLSSEALSKGVNKSRSFLLEVEARLNYFISFLEVVQEEHAQEILQNEEEEEIKLSKQLLGDNLKDKKIEEPVIQETSINQEMSDQPVDNYVVGSPKATKKRKKLSQQERNALKDQKIDLEKKISERNSKMYAKRLSSASFPTQEEILKDTEIIFISKEVEKNFNSALGISFSKNKISEIMKNIKNDGTSDVGRLEALTGPLKGWLSLRITQKDRFVYCIRDGIIYIGSCLGHYTNVGKLQSYMKGLNKELSS